MKKQYEAKTKRYLRGILTRVLNRQLKIIRIVHKDIKLIKIK
jgi:hypothetical protein